MFGKEKKGGSRIPYAVDVCRKGKKGILAAKGEVGMWESECPSGGMTGGKKSDGDRVVVLGRGGRGVSRLRGKKKGGEGSASKSSETPRREREGREKTGGEKVRFLREKGGKKRKKRGEKKDRPL